MENRSLSTSHKPRIMLAGPLSPEPIIGGIENGIRLYLRSPLPEAITCSFFNTYRQPSQRSLVQRVASQLRMIAMFLVALVRHRPALVHVKSSSGLHFYQQAGYAVLAVLSGRRLIFQIHSGHFESFFRSQPGWLQAGSRWLLKRADCLLCLSPYWAGVLRQLVPGCQVAVIPNAVALEQFEPCYTQRLERASAPVTVLFIGTTVARLNHRKGLYDLLAALREIDVRGMDFRLILAGCDRGDGEEAEALEAFVSQAGFAVETYGAIDEAAKLALLAQADLFVLPSHVENFPNTLLEAMAAGLPVIGTHVGGVPDLVEEGVNGYLYAPGEVRGLKTALETLLDDPGKRQQMGQCNLAIIRDTYDSPKVHGAIQSLYEQVLMADRVTLQGPSTTFAE